MEKEEIESLLKELIKEKQESEKILSILKSLTSNGEIYKTIFEDLKKQIETSLNDIKTSKGNNTKYYNEIKSQYDKIVLFIDNSNKYISDVKNIKNSIISLEKDINKSNDNILSTKESLKSKQEELKTINNDLNNIIKSIKSIGNESTKILEKINSNKDLSNTLITYLKGINKEAKENNEEISKVLKQSNKFLVELTNRNKQIEDFYKNTDSKNKDILKWYEKIFNPNGIKEQILGIETKIKNDQNRIDEQLSLSGGLGLSTALKNKVDKLEISVEKWKKRISEIALVLTLFLMVFNALNLFFKWGLNSFQIFELLSPLVFLLLFSAFQYTKEYKFLEEYNFKFISAFSLPAYFALLEDKDNKESVKYLIETVNSIYKNPSKDIMCKI